MVAGRSHDWGGGGVAIETPIIYGVQTPPVTQVHSCGGLLDPLLYLNFQVAVAARSIFHQLHLKDRLWGNRTLIRQ